MMPDPAAINSNQVGTCRRSSSEYSDSSKPQDADDRLAAPNWNPNPSTWRLGGGAALVVAFRVFEVVGLRRVQPSVHHDPEQCTVCVFQGYLSNLDELSERYCDPAEGSPRAVVSQGRDPREVAAEVVFRMFSRGTEPLVILSELQGQYAFALYDGDRRQLFAARDSSGKEALHYHIDDDGGVSLSNACLSVPGPDGIGFLEWAELPPGHYITGRSPKVLQFALTPAQLSEREREETIDDDASPQGSSPHRRLSDEFGDMLTIH